MNCCERTLVTLACVAGMVDRDKDSDSGHQVVQAHIDAGLCAECAKQMVTLQGSMKHGQPVRTIGERIAHEYVLAIDRCAEISDIQKSQINAVVVESLNFHLSQLGPQ